MKKTTILYCFTPIVTLITFIIELCLGIYVLVHYRKTHIARISVVLLLVLSIFQISEYIMCTTSGHNDFWVRFGWIAVIMLPALGIHLIQAINQKEKHIFVPIAYLSAIAISIWIITSPEPLLTYSCTGHFIAFQPISAFHVAYYWHYVIFLILAMLQAFRYSVKNMNRKANIWMIIGYLSFIVPTLLLAEISEKASTGVPSIMCGFAILIAIIIAGRVVPLTQKTRE